MAKRLRKQRIAEANPNRKNSQTRMAGAVGAGKKERMAKPK